MGNSYALLCFFLGLLLLVGSSSAVKFAGNRYSYCGNVKVGLALPNATVLAEYRLAMVHQLFRHGDRTALAVMPDDFSDPNLAWTCTLSESMHVVTSTAASEPPPSRLFRKAYVPNVETLPGNCELGQLTSFGLSQHIAIGHQVGAYYRDAALGGFLPVDIVDADVYLRSTDVPRTLASLQGELVAIWPEVTGAPTTALPTLWTVDLALDWMTPNVKLCPRLGQLYNEIYNSSAYNALWREYDWLNGAVVKAFGTRHVPNLLDVSDAMHARVCHDMPIPPALAGVLEPLFEFAALENDFFVNGTLLLRLGIGRLLGELVSSLKACAADGSCAPRYRLWSGHDSTMRPLSRALGITDEIWPPYASHMFLELYLPRSSSSALPPLVRLFYNDLWRPVPGCPPSDELCPLSTFAAAVVPLIPVDFDAECAVQ